MYAFADILVGTVIGNHDLAGRVALACQREQRFSEEIASIVHGNHDTHWLHVWISSSESKGRTRSGQPLTRDAYGGLVDDSSPTARGLPKKKTMMKISGFSFVRNGLKLYYPVIESISSVLPLVDEFVVAVGNGDPDDTTKDAILAIKSEKVRIIDTIWDERLFTKGIINAIQTDIAKEVCSGDWLFYLQADEVIHERYLSIIQRRCEELLPREEVEGLLFRYKHFWGDYDHFHRSHGWYPFEIRIIRNRPDIHSWQSAQSFRRFDYYEGPRQPAGHHKLKVALVDAEVYHYGWVRPPRLMTLKSRALNTLHRGLAWQERSREEASRKFEYGPLDRLALFSETHPAVMRGMIERMDWKGTLQFSGRPDPRRLPHKHERFKYRLLTFLEQRLFGGRQIGGFQNYVVLKDA